MPWFKVDDGFHCHPKAMRAGNAALGLWTRAGSWAAHQLTDGFIPIEIVRTYGTVGQANALVQAGLWVKAEGGYRFHEWTAPGRNMSRSEVEELRELKRAAGKKGGRASGKSRAEAKQKPSKPEAEPKQAASPLVNQTVLNTNPIQSNPTSEPTVLPATTSTDGQRINAITKAYAEAEPMCNFVAVRGIVAKAHKTGEFSDIEIRDALLRLAREGRSVTVDTLRTELRGFTPRRNSSNTENHLALIARLEAGGQQ